ncbi:Regulator of RpoS [subsurface metagenome]
MGGKIWVHSRLLKGSAFNFTLPYFDTSDVKLKKKKKEKPKKKVLPSYDWRNKTILIVEDEQNNFVYLNEIIKRTGAKVLEAKNGKQSIESVENHSEINLVLMDIMMPGMNGYEVCEKLKANNQTKDIPIIFLTAKTETKNIIKGFNTGGVDYITKPFIKEELLARIQTHVNLKISKDLLKEQAKKIKKANKIILESVRKFGHIFRDH